MISEDYKLIKYILDEGLQAKVMGNTLWKDLETLEVIIVLHECYVLLHTSTAVSLHSMHRVINHWLI